MFTRAKKEPSANRSAAAANARPSHALVDGRQENLRIGKVQRHVNGSERLSQLKDSSDIILQKVERQTTIFNQNAGDNHLWDKNMQIIDSTDPSDYVHMSRSTTTDPEQIHIHDMPADIVHAAPGRRQRTELAGAAAPVFDRAQFTAANNAHITLEGRYMQVMHTLLHAGFDNRIAIKAGPPVGDFTNLNFGDFNVHGAQISHLGIEQWIEDTADETEDQLRTNTLDMDEVPDDEVEAEEFLEQHQEHIGELVGVVGEVKDSTLAFTENLIATTPELNAIDDDDRLVHYNGAVWPPVQLE